MTTHEVEKEYALQIVAAKIRLQRVKNLSRETGLAEYDITDFCQEGALTSVFSFDGILDLWELHMTAHGRAVDFRMSHGSKK